ncbi:MAG: dihydroxy-acid dehydratase 4 [Pseudomonadota bacterium]
MALGCSTNAVIHLLAMSKRAGVALSLDDLDAIGRVTPVIANVRPVGKTALMEDFFYAGGLRALMANLSDRLDLSVMTVSGITLGEALSGAKVYNDDVIRSLDNPVYHEGSLAVLKGNLAPDGAVIKPAACDPRFYQHVGPALVADHYDELISIIENEDLEISPETVLILRNAGPQGGPGMPEWGMIPMPKALLKRGIRDMVRMSDARMSGTSYGACVLHIAPEAYVGGPLAWVQNGDLIELNIPKRSLNVLVSEEELEQRRRNWTPPPRRYERGYGFMFSQHIEQADKGCDFDFLKTEFGGPVSEPEIH